MPAGPCRDTMSRSGRRGGVFVNEEGGSGGRCDSGSLSPESPPRAGSRPPTPARGLDGDTRPWTGTPPPVATGDSSPTLRGVVHSGVLRDLPSSL